MLYEYVYRTQYYTYQYVRVQVSGIDIKILILYPVLVLQYVHVRTGVLVQYVSKILVQYCTSIEN